jgi:hypothetical protein
MQKHQAQQMEAHAQKIEEEPVLSCSTPAQDAAAAA